LIRDLVLNSWMYSELSILHVSFLDQKTDYKTFESIN